MTELERRPAGLGKRLLALFFGLVLFGVSIALLVASGLGLDSWDVFHQGLANRTGLGLGTVVILVGAVVLALWIPLRERPGVGTISNVIVVGLALDAALLVLPEPDALPLQVLFMLSGIFLNAVATSLYIGAGLGPGPRDGLMTGLAKRGYSIRLVRTGIEVVVLIRRLASRGHGGNRDRALRTQHRASRPLSAPPSISCRVRPRRCPSYPPMGIGHSFEGEET